MGWKMKTGSIERLWLAASAAAALMLCGCSSIAEHTHAYLGTPRLAPTHPNAIQIFATEPNRPKQRLGEIILSIAGNPARQDIEKKLKTAAARLGADGVFIVSDRTRVYPIVYWDWWGSAAVDEDWRRAIVGVAFKLK